MWKTLLDRTVGWRMNVMMTLFTTSTSSLSMYPLVILLCKSPDADRRFMAHKLTFRSEDIVYSLMHTSVYSMTSDSLISTCYSKQFRNTEAPSSTVVGALHLSLWEGILKGGTGFIEWKDVFFFKPFIQLFELHGGSGTHSFWAPCLLSLPSYWPYLRCLHSLCSHREWREIQKKTKHIQQLSEKRMTQ